MRANSGLSWWQTALLGGFLGVLMACFAVLGEGRRAWRRRERRDQERIRAGLPPEPRIRSWQALPIFGGLGAVLGLGGWLAWGLVERLQGSRPAGSPRSFLRQIIDLGCLLAAALLLLFAFVFSIGLGLALIG